MPDENLVAYLGGEAEAAVEWARGLEENGLAARCVPAQHTRSGGSSLLLIVLLAVPLHAFLTALGKTMGEAAGTTLSALAKSTFAKRSQKVRSQLVVRDTARGIDIEITDSLPPEAYAMLSTLEIADYVTVTYDVDSGTWVAVDRRRGA